MKKTIRLLVSILSLLLLIGIKNIQAAELITPKYDTLDTIVADIVLSPNSNNRTSDIKNALSKCSQNHGGTVYLQSGIYNVSGTITIPRGCTLRGDWQDPDSGTNYGTIIKVDVNKAKYDSYLYDDTGLFKMSASSGVIGLTIYYENQGVGNNLKDQPWTFYYGHGEYDASDSNKSSFGRNIIFYKPGLFTIKNITLINSFRGIGESTKESIDSAMMRIENIKGTTLYKGITVHNLSDVGIITNLNLKPDYWLKANKSSLKTNNNMPTKAQIMEYTLNKGTGIVLTDSEMGQMANVSLSGYKYGIYIPKESSEVVRRAMGSGTIYNLNVTECEEGIHAEDGYFIHNYIGYQITHSFISGTRYSIFNNGLSYQGRNSIIKLSDVKLSGPIGGNNGQVIYFDIKSNSYQKINNNNYIPDYSNSNTALANIYLNRKTKTYGKEIMTLAPISSSAYQNDKNIDATRIQNALNNVGNKGGGVVYLKPGIYYLHKQIFVPENVELRGSASSTPKQTDLPTNVSKDGFSLLNTNSFLGTIINIDPADITDKYSSTIELNGNNSGISGIYIAYERNIQSMQGTLTDYKYTNSAPSIGAHGKKGVYITNITIIGASMGIGIDQCDSFVISDISSTTFSTFAMIVNSQKGLIKNTLHNATVLSLNVHYHFHEGYFINLIKTTNNNLNYIQIFNSKNIEAINNFAYAPRSLFALSNTTGYFINNGNDNFPGNSNSQNLADSYNHVMFNIYNSTTTNATIINSHRYNGENGKLLNNDYAASNKINVYNSSSVQLKATDDNSKYENDSVSQKNSPISSSQLFTYVPKSVNKKGDINDDNTINALDYIILRKYILKTVTLTTNQQEIADINSDGTINAADYISLRKMILYNM